MKPETKRMLAAMLGGTMLLGTCAGCGKNTAAEADPETEAETEEPVRIVTIADGRKHITVEDTENKTIAQLLAEAGVTLKEGDVLSVDPASDDLALRVLHRVTVTVVDAASEYPEETEHTLILVGCNVADAIEAAGIKMEKNWATNFDDEAELKDKMLIVITDPDKIKEAEEKAAAEAAARAARAAAGNSSSGSSGSRSSGGGGSRSSGGGGGGSSKPVTPTKTVVSTSVYEDCDGSGHGVKVITYSDGSQQEVAF